MTAQQIRVESLHNQTLVALDGHLDKISAIAEHGPQTLEDLTIIKMCMCFLAGLLHKKRAEAGEME